MTRKLASGLALAGVLAAVAPANALAHGGNAPDVQKFRVFDDTQDGLVATDDPVIGGVVAIANPRGKSRLLLTIGVHKAARNCPLYVELTRDYAETNGGLDANGHIGSVPRFGFTKVIGQFETNSRGNGAVHLDIDPSKLGGDGDGVADKRTFAHLDLEPAGPSGALGDCTEDDGTKVEQNEYGAAPDPLGHDPFTFFE